jgi:hypothetical protein
MPRASRDRWLFPMFAALCLMVMALTVTVVLLAMANAHQGRDIDAFKQSTRETCLRTKTYGPSLADAYAKYSILNDGQLKAYRDGLPTSCP